AGLGKEKRQHKIKWHFGIGSRSPRMEVMLEIYRTLKVLGMEWKEKGDLGGLRGVRPTSPSSPSPHDKTVLNRDLDDSGGVDMTKAAVIYFVETQRRVQDVVVLMNLQPHMVNSINYLVDFHHKRTYKAPMEPGASKFDMA
ncbi:KA1 domain/Ssp2 C-terminal domain-containing protein, partial [Cyathus striatus]